MEQIICIFCGKKADIIRQDNASMVVFGFCKRETELDEYKEMVDQWLEKL